MFNIVFSLEQFNDELEFNLFIANILSNLKKLCHYKTYSIIVSNEITLFFKNIFKKFNIQLIETDFNNIADIDRKIKSNTILAFCEYPSSYNFKTYDFNQIYNFLNFFNIPLCCSFIFSDPMFCNINLQNINFKFKRDIKLISQCVANNKKILKILKNKGLNFNIVLPSSSPIYNDYKNHRLISKIDSYFLLLYSNNNDNETIKFYKYLQSALNDNVLFYELNNKNSFKDYQSILDNIEHYKCFLISDNKEKYRIILKAGFDSNILNAFKII